MGKSSVAARCLVIYQGLQGWWTNSPLTCEPGKRRVIVRMGSGQTGCGIRNQKQKTDVTMFSFGREEHRYTLCKFAGTGWG